MSHSGIRVRRQQAPRNRWLEAGLAAVAIVVLVVYLSFGQLWIRESKRDDVVTDGRILDTRIAVDDIRHTSSGGRINYRLEARVNYNLDGQMQDRWMTASEPASREELLAALAQHPHNCRVYGVPNHAENPQCRLELPDRAP